MEAKLIDIPVVYYLLYEVTFTQDKAEGVGCMSRLQFWVKVRLGVGSVGVMGRTDMY